MRLAYDCVTVEQPRRLEPEGHRPFVATFRYGRMYERLPGSDIDMLREQPCALGGP